MEEEITDFHQTTQDSKKNSCPFCCMGYLETPKKFSTKVKDQKLVPWTRRVGLRPTPGKLVQKKSSRGFAPRGRSVQVPCWVLYIQGLT